MYITKTRIKEIIREEIQNYRKNLKEGKTIRLPKLDIIQHNPNKAQFMSYTGRMPVTRQDAKAIIYAIRKHLSILYTQP